MIRVKLSSLVQYYSQWVSPSMMEGVETVPDLEGVLKGISRFAKIPPMEEAERTILTEPPPKPVGDAEEPIVGQESSDSARETLARATGLQDNFSFASRRPKWADVLGGSPINGNQLLISGCGHVLGSQKYSVKVDDVMRGSTVLALYAQEAGIGAMLLLPYIYDMAMKRRHHLVQSLPSHLTAGNDEPLFTVKNNKKVLHLDAQIADAIDAEKCLYALEIYKLMQPFASLGILPEDMHAALVFVSGVRDGDTYTPSPFAQQFIGAVAMLGLPLRESFILRHSTDYSLTLTPSDGELRINNSAVAILGTDKHDIAPKFHAIIERFHKFLDLDVRNDVIRTYVWNNHVPVAVAMAGTNINSLKRRLARLKREIMEPGDGPLRSRLEKLYATWHNRIPSLVMLKRTP